MNKIKDGFWVKHYPEKQTVMLREMSYEWRVIEARSKKLYTQLILFGIASLFIFILFPQKWMGLLPLGLMFLVFTSEKMKITKTYESFNDQRHFEFLYFFQLLVPHLKQATSSRLGLFNVLTKMEARLPSEDEGGGILKKGVNQLLVGITNRPADIEVFKEFARDCSGTDLAEDVCVALFDWQQNSADIKQLDRLKDLVNNALDQRVAEVADKKLGKFEWYSARVLLLTVGMSIVILVAVVILQGIDIFKNVTI